jgi:hypothetical protein
MQVAIVQAVWKLIKMNMELPIGTLNISLLV